MRERGHGRAAADEATCGAALSPLSLPFTPISFHSLSLHLSQSICVSLRLSLCVSLSVPPSHPFPPLTPHSLARSFTHSLTPSLMPLFNHTFFPASIRTLCPSVFVILVCLPLRRTLRHVSGKTLPGPPRAITLPAACASKGWRGRMMSSRGTTCHSTCRCGCTRTHDTYTHMCVLVERCRFRLLFRNTCVAVGRAWTHVRADAGITCAGMQARAQA